MQVMLRYVVIRLLLFLYRGCYVVRIIGYVVLFKLQVGCRSSIIVALDMQTVNVKTSSSLISCSQAMRDHTYKMEQNDNSLMADGDYDNVELVSKSGDSLLISLVQNYPHLYVKSSKNQKDNNSREKSWQEIASILEQPASECLKRWTRLRERYSKEKRLSEQGLRHGITLSNRQSWPHYSEMGFLAQHIVGRRSYRNINSKLKRVRDERTYSKEAPSPPEHQTSSSSPVPFTSTLIVQSPSPSPSTSMAIVASPELLSPDTSEHSRGFGNSGCNQRVKQPSALFEECIPETKLMVVNQSRHNNNDNDNNQQVETSEDLFCKYLASELKKMTENEKKATTRRLMDALFQGNT